MKQSFLTVVIVLLCSVTTAAQATLKAGAARVDITPIRLPVLVNGGMLSRSVENVSTRLYARAIVLDDGQQRLGIVVADSCMMSRSLLDEAKQLASQRTSILPDRMLISATHTHTAPASMGCLGTNADPMYVPYLREKLAEVLATAEANLELARVGWAVGNAAEFTALRRWIRRPDRIETDPFGNPTVRANMHAGSNWDDVTGESGPEDPDLSIISLQARDGRPIAALANFSMHYFSGETGLSADYFGRFCRGLESHFAPQPKENQPAFVAIMSHGCSGDIWRRDYRVPPDSRQEHTIQSYTEGLLRIAVEACSGIQYRADADLGMAEARMNLKYRTPNQQRLEWARKIVKAMGEREPRDRSEVYAREQIILHERQSTEVVLQAIRIGDITIATTPTETYALTGLKLKRQSPLEKTMVIELANGGDGYIPPPEQHALGGYNTWAARSAGLEIDAEPKIAEAALSLLEQVAGRPRRDYRQPRGSASEAILRARPIAYWRLDEFGGALARDASGHDRNGVYESGVAFFLPGPHGKAYCGSGFNRAVHFAGGRLRARIGGVRDRYSVALWFWNGMPVDGRETSGWMFSRGRNHGRRVHGDQLGIGGTARHTGKLIYQYGNEPGVEQLGGRTAIKRWSWNHVVFVRDLEHIRVHLNGASNPEIKVKVNPLAGGQSGLFFGGRCDNQANWEGRLDEVAVFDRALSTVEIGKLAAVK